MNGYQPDGKHLLDITDPPRGGSGVPKTGPQESPYFIVHDKWNPPSNLEVLHHSVRAWQNQTFGKLPPEAYVAKLLEELGELVADPHSMEELADCFILLLGIAAAQGHSANGLLRAANGKHYRNMERTWVQNPDGTWRHEG